jgi:pimeloyl-ACP methyl ester carboxylesterase
MIWNEMRQVRINGADLAILERGDGEPVMLLHGGMSDEYAALLEEPALTNSFRLIHYHQRGWGKSERADGAMSIAQHVDDCMGVMQHLGIERAHFVGESSGGVLALQVALDHPGAVHSLALFEPALPSALAAPEFVAMVQRAGAMYEAGDKRGATEAFGREVVGDDVREMLDRTMPEGWFDRWVEDVDNIFGGGAEEIMSWKFTPEEAARITQPVLNVMGADTRPYFRDAYETLRKWLPQAENVVIPDAIHGIVETNPRAAAEQLAGFFARHPVPDYARTRR